MWYVTSIAIILAGILGAASIIAAKKPDAQQLIDKLTPYQGIIGVLNFLWGVYFVLWLFLHMSVGIRWIIFLVTSVAMVLLGFLLGFGLISKYALSKSPEAMKKGEELRGKLAKFIGPLGIVGIVAGVLSLLACFVW
jgi:membrane-bound ClpP family serine protease